MSYMTISSQENHHFHSVHTFTHIRQHCFSKYWGGPMHGPSPPPQILGGAVPPSPPLGLRPWPCLDLLPLLPLIFGIAFHPQLVLLSYHPIFLRPYHFLKLVS